jgi:hypothetical protein
VADVGAVVLTVGEATTGRALASLTAQTLPLEEIEVVAGVRPFHRALTAGAEAITTPYVLQVDADMVLDPDCAEVLRAAMTPGVGIAVGLLRDALMGTVVGVKLFRRECFDLVPHRDVLAPEVDFYERLDRLGWQTRYLLRHLGDHAPDDSAELVYGRYYLLGARYASRDDPRGLAWRHDRLAHSRHPMAGVARLALGHGAAA